MTTHAPTLRQLLELRRLHLPYLRSIPNYRGSAIGHKHIGGQPVLDAQGNRIPAILVFVEGKGKPVPKKYCVCENLPASDGWRCLTDVVEGALPAAPPASPAPTGANAKVWRELRNRPIKITGGIPLTSDVATGTAACLVRTKANGTKGKLGLLTNWHVSGLVGNRLLQPQPFLRPIGVTSRLVFTAEKHTKNRDDLESFTDADHRLDAGFVELFPGNARAVQPGVHSLEPLGEPHRIDLDSPKLDLIGETVIGVGQTLGRQRGKIVAYGYEWKPDRDDPQIYATDYLIVGETSGQPFAAAGDSGKLVVTEKGNIPVALLWGGQRQGFWNTNAQESWAYASAIRTVLDALELEIEPTKRRRSEG